MGLSRSVARLLSANRLAVFSILLLVVFTAATVIFAGLREREMTLGEMQSLLSVKNQLNVDTLTQRIEQLRNSARFLARVPPVQGIVNASNIAEFDTLEKTPLNLWQRRLETIFSAFVATNPEITQVSFIGLANQGRELIRVDQIGEQIVIVPTNQLVAKGESSYFQATKRLAGNLVYLSDINLDHEYGKVQIPSVPILRITSPVFESNGSFFGMVVINVNAKLLMEPLGENLSLNYAAYLINSQGDFLLHPDTGKILGSNLGRTWRWKDEFHTLPIYSKQWSKFQQYQSPAGIVHAIAQTIPLDTNDPARFIEVILVASDVLVADAVANRHKATLLIVLSGALLICGIAFLFLRQRRLVIEQQAKIASIVNSSFDAIISKTLDGKVTSWNMGAERMFGFSAPEAIGKFLNDLIVPPNVIDEEADILVRVTRGEILSNFRTRRHDRNGTTIDVSETVSPIRSANGTIIGVSTMARDITEQKATETKIRELNASLEQQVRERTVQVENYSILQRTIVSHAPFSIIACDINGVITLLNPAAEGMLGYRADETVGKLTPEAFHEPGELQSRAVALSQELGDVIAPGFEVFIAQARRNMPDDHEWTYIRKDGSRFPVLLSISALINAEGVITGFLSIAIDISKRQEDKRKLLSARDQLFNAGKIAELGIWTWDLVFNSLEWNERMYEIYELPIEQQGSGLYYEYWYSRIHPDDVEVTVNKLMALVAGTGSYDLIFRIVRMDGSIRFIQAAAQAERDENGQALRVLGINRDITQQHEQEQILRTAVNAADNANRAKSEFVANMSHEIRSPMNAVLGMLQLLQQTKLNSLQHDYVGKAETSARALLVILNDILDFSKIEAGQLLLDPHPFNFDKLLRDLAVILSINVSKDIEVLFDIASDLPSWVVGDALRLQQVLLNLVGNAIKFTKHGEVVLSARRVVHEKTELSIAFTIRDTGIGISPDQYKHIFTSFSQAETSTTRRFGGTGLGLAISQRLVGLMGGTISVDSMLGKGSTFSFVIKCLQADAQEYPKPECTRQLQHLECLVIDDNASARLVLANMLSSFGWQADMVNSGKDGLDAVARRGEEMPYDVILVDWHLPGMDGWETSKRLRRSIPTGKAPQIIMLTTYDREELVERQAQFPTVLDGMLVKPITASMLFDAVADAVGNQSKDTQIKMVGYSSQQRLTGLRLLVVEDNAINQQVANQLLSNDGALVEVVDGGMAAINAVSKANPQFDAVLMDIQMPDMDGYAATRAIREQLGMSALPIIAMTANALITDRMAALAAGMNDHVGKPFDLSQLIAVILRHVRNDEYPATEITGNIEPSSLSGLNSAAALARFGGDSELYRDVLLGFLSEVTKLVAQLQIARAKQQRDKAMGLLHTLKGLAGTVGADQLASLVAQEEQTLKDLANEEKWPDSFNIVLSVSQQAANVAQQLSTQFDLVNMTTSIKSVVNDSGLQTGLTRLVSLLNESNLDALRIFKELRRNYSASMPGEFTRLAQAINQMDFEESSHICTVMLQYLETNLP